MCEVVCVRGGGVLGGLGGVCVRVRCVELGVLVVGRGGVWGWGLCLRVFF